MSGPQKEEPRMLGENHSIHHEFPHWRELTDELARDDLDFREMVNEHDKLDKTIRGLEEREGPISDTEIERMKKRRLQLKDEVYRILLNKANGEA
ncbi:YdcH family protein [Marinobacteraceae bacterium S3BR75-40.1]